MADPVAIISILSSASLAAGTLVVQYRTGQAQRGHERSLAYEGRVWEKKSTALYAVITTATRFDYRTREMSKTSLAMMCSEAVEVCHEHIGVVEAYTPDECRWAFTEFERLVRESGAPALMSYLVTEYRREKEEAIDAVDFDRAARMRDKEKKLLDEAEESFTGDRLTLVKAAERLVTEARKALGSEQNTTSLQRRLFSRG